jgi:hypothetical protein
VGEREHYTIWGLGGEEAFLRMEGHYMAFGRWHFWGVGGSSTVLLRDWGILMRNDIELLVRIVGYARRQGAGANI